MNSAVFDTHFHSIDFRFPVSENQGFMPPSFPVKDYRMRTAGLGIEAGVVVTGSFQNFDTIFLRDALQNSIRAQGVLCERPRVLSSAQLKKKVVPHWGASPFSYAMPTGSRNDSCTSPGRARIMA